MAAPMNPICLLNGFYTPLPQVLLLTTDGQMGFLINFPKWLHIGKETYLDRLCLRYEKEGRPSQLSPVDLFVSKVDPLKEPHLVTANTVLSILAVDYHVDKNDFVDDPGAVPGTMKANHIGMRWSLF